MTARPPGAVQRETARILGREAARAAARTRLRAAGYEPVDPPVVTPAQPFIDLSGEEIRARLFHVTDPEGRELCLRPEITIPAVGVLLRAGWRGEGLARISYDGPVFRAGPPGQPVEVLQAGAECLGPFDPPEADAEMLALAADATPDWQDFVVGDVALFDELLAGLGVAPDRKARLLQGRDEEEPAAGGTPGLGARLGALPPADGAALLRDLMGAAGIAAVGDRPVEDIVARLIAKARGAEPLPPETRRIVRSYRGLEMPLAAAPGRMADIFRSEGAPAGTALARLRERVARLDRLAPGLSARLRFRPGLKLGLAYYTGLVFELARAGVTVARGGRYDRLVGLLAPGIEAPAVGFAVTLDAGTGGVA